MKNKMLVGQNTYAETGGWFEPAKWWVKTTRKMTHLRTLSFALVGFGFARQQHCSSVHYFAAAIAAIHDGFGGWFSSWATAPTITPWVLVITTEALLPNSYFLCSLPLLRQ